MSTNPTNPRVRIAVPWRPDGAWRDRLWAWCKPAWDETGWPIVQATGPAGPFNRSAAVNTCANGDWDVLLIVDADIVRPPIAQLDRAIRLAERTGQLVVAYERRLNLTSQVTRRLVNGWTVDPTSHVQTVLDGSLSSVVVVPRRLWDAVGGMDERFIGWGCDDTAFHHACATIGEGWHRVPGDVWHLWHERQPERQRGGQPMHPLLAANKALVARYRACTTTEALYALLSEPGGPKAVTTPLSSDRPADGHTEANPEVSA